MKMFLDFEATQFSNRIISIGCVAENGNTFKTLVKPVGKGKVNEFITNLTGITKEMLVEAPSADEAFSAFYDFVEANSEDSFPEYYCYGNSDVEFIKHTVKYMTNFKAITFALSLQYNLINYSRDLQKILKINRELSLKVAHGLINSEEHEQKHDALEDAIMLKEVFNKANGISQSDANAAAAKPADRTGYPPKTKAPAIFVNWPNRYAEMYNADTLADENSWAICCIDKESQAIKYFPDLSIAALWIMKYKHWGSPKKPQDIAKVTNKIEAVLNKEDKGYYGFTWLSVGKEENENV